LPAADFGQRLRLAAFCTKYAANRDLVRRSFLNSPESNSAPGRHPVARWITAQLWQPLHEINQAPRLLYEDPPAAARADRAAFIVLTTSAIFLSIRSYWNQLLPLGMVLDYCESIPLNGSTSIGGFLRQPENHELTRLGYWVLAQSIAYILGPVLIIKLVLRERLRDYGLKLRGMLSGWYIYVAMYLLLLPLVMIVSTTSSFQHSYPFYRLAADEPLWPRFIIWQCMYAFQFFALEFFFRGYMVHGSKQRLGAQAVVAMTIPYCMIHFGKPLPETLGAIVAGVLLGFMSLKTRSIWLGAALHVAVAWSMDFSALLQKRWF